MYRRILVALEHSAADATILAHVHELATLTGAARVVRGDFQFAGKRFEFDDTGTVSLSTKPEQIRLNLRAVRELKGLLDYYRRDRALKQYVDIDTRAVDEIERKLVANPMDPAAIVWMRQIVNAWSSRLRGDEKEKEMRHVLTMIKST